MEEGLYAFQGQKPDNTDCGAECSKVTRANYDEERWQTGFLKGTVAAGVITFAAGQSVELFRFGMGEDASGAGFIKSSSADVLFGVADTNVHKNNGLHGFSVRSVGVALGDLCTLTASTGSDGKTVLAIGEDINADGYREKVLRRLSEHCRVDLARCADEASEEGQARTFGLGSILRNSSHRASYRDLNTPNVSGMPGVPMPLARAFDIKPATGTERPFKVVLKIARALTIATRSDAVTADQYVPVTVFLGGVPFLG